ncbi:hypothetical protein A3C23_05110 [Candidatus Roizmanbacteria bacterium RIFCSPHIGHO2_02_FULL_37_13b]|uniref:Glycosyltransferase RgtA/B/C/D-like domain-containing protein n=1 Tax=Candidatus Roizmanbacteria bacterium RIFCSPLOWO2_02_FULL_36_11 TaxID=1802071 RepID=A0A1F7JFM6_9BACT|nr:MAG: hypothetical protein A3C23_05110 [Candidatus Roizmanbacteria bacterium RIFCSPHIGHO2_02_FULL_37_13b]OGK54401.1 MAG: hypothetical protein A3H78_03720 [Candidatus Roizmanbacteria bacterium RIFCSPLOWO2_02_FULL_36_11]
MLKKMLAFFNKNRFAQIEIIILITTLVVFIINAQYVTYPDEFVNLLGGKALLAGKLPYRDFFDNHMPLPWYLSAVLIKMSAGSYIVFRFLWSMFQFALLFILGVWIKSQNRSLYNYYLGFLITFPLLAVYFWLHLYLADSLAVLFFAVIFWLLMTLTLTQKINKKMLYIASLLTFCLIFSSMTFLYLSGALYLWQLYLLIRSQFDRRSIINFLAFAALPYLVYFVYLVLTGSLSDFIFANFTYNTNQYIGIANYTRGRLFNPLKFGLALIFNFWHEYIPLLAKLKDLSLNLPIITLSGLAGFLLLLILSSYSFVLGIIFFLLMSFTAPRSNLQTANETDYQMGVFLVFGLSAAFIAIYYLRRIKLRDELLNDIKRLSVIMTSVLLLFTFLFLAKNTYEKWYLRYSQAMPSIYDLAPSASFTDEIIGNNDYYWMGPFEPQEMFFVKKAKLASKYPVLLPQYKENGFLKNDFINQLDKTRPTLIIFKTDMGIFMTPAEKFADFLLVWMSDKYTLLEKIPNIKILKSPSSFTLGHHLFIRNDKQEQILMKLKKRGYIE